MTSPPSSSRLHSLAGVVLGRPTLVILIGRGIAQVGLLAFVLASSTALGDGDFNALTVGVTVVTMLVTAPVAALQMHLVRDDDPVAGTRSMLRFAAACVVPAALASCAVGGVHWWYLLIAVGPALSALPIYRTSLLAKESRFLASAELDAIGGIALGGAAATLVVTEGSAFAWAAGFLVAQAIYLLVGAAPAFRPAARATSRRGRMWDDIVGARSLIVLGAFSFAFNRVDYLILTVVGSDAEASRYALAGRFVGPVLLALGSLNNSLFVRQLGVDDAEVRTITRATSRRMIVLAIGLVPAVGLLVVVVQTLIPSIGDRSLLVPSLLLAAATVPYALVVPYAFAFAARNREGIWLRILASAVVADAVVVALVGGSGAVAVSLVWIAIQVAVGVATLRAARGLGLFGTPPTAARGSAA